MPVAESLTYTVRMGIQLRLSPANCLSVCGVSEVSIQRSPFAALSGSDTCTNFGVCSVPSALQSWYFILVVDSAAHAASSPPWSVMSAVLRYFLSGKKTAYAPMETICLTPVLDSTSPVTSVPL